MSTGHFLVCLSWISLWTYCSSECPSTTRVRRPWHSLSNNEQLLYVNGFQTISRNGVLKHYIEAHKKAATGNEIKLHYSSQDFYWHSYWLYELENEFRALGGEFECFTLPYWDVTKDAAYWNLTENPQVDDVPIYGGNLGGNGNVDDNYCVGGLWSLDHYVTDSLCADDEESGKCCLKRWHIQRGDPAGTAVLHSQSEFTNKIFTDSQYEEFGNFSDAISAMHGGVHWFFATLSNNHFNQMSGEVAADPLFPVFHSFMDYVRLMRTDCYQFDTVAADALDSLMPYSYQVVDCPLDFKMDFSILCDDNDGERHRLCSDMDITPRLMYDVSPNTQFNIVYELGDFWNDNDRLKASCSEYLNGTWWVHTAPDRILADLHSVNRFTAETTVGAVLFLFIAGMLIALMQRLAALLPQTPPRRKIVDLNDQKTVYGAV